MVVAVGAGLMAARMVMTSGSSTPDQAGAPEVEKAEQTEILVAVEDISLGAKLSPAQIDWVAWPANALPSGVISKKDNPDGAKDNIGKIARAPIYSGEPIRPERLIDTDKGFMSAILPKGKRAIAVGVEAETTAGGFILPGDKVDLILTRESDTGAVSETILENIRVLAIDATTAGEKDQANLSPKRTATLELTLSQSEIVTQSQQVGTISLVLRSAEDSADDAVVSDVRRRGVTFVKYGLTSQATSE